jgi:hypothetical protein
LLAVSAFPLAMAFSMLAQGVALGGLPQVEIFARHVLNASAFGFCLVVACRKGASIRTLVLFSMLAALVRLPTFFLFVQGPEQDLLALDGQFFWWIFLFPWLVSWTNMWMFVLAVRRFGFGLGVIVGIEVLHILLFTLLEVAFGSRPVGSLLHSWPIFLQTVLFGALLSASIGARRDRLATLIGAAVRWALPVGAALLVVLKERIASRIVEPAQQGLGSTAAEAAEIRRNLGDIADVYGALYIASASMVLVAAVLWIRVLISSRASQPDSN